MEKLISHQLVNYLEERGIEHIFGLCGHTNIAVLTALEESKIKFINVRHEQIAAHAADGYARVTKKAAVVLSHLGPGLTNAATGVANAALDSIPMVVIAGDDKDLKKPREVKEVLVEEGKVIVDGVNIITKHTKPSAQNTKGGIVKKEAPIHISNVMLWDGKQATKVKREVKDDKKVRVSKKSGGTI